MVQAHGIPWIQHALPGRIRLKWPALRFNEGACQRIEHGFNAIKGVLGTRANPKSASVVIRYEVNTLPQATLLVHAKSLFAASKTVTHAPRPARCPSPAGQDRRADELKFALRRFLAMSILAIGVLTRQLVTKRPLAQNLFSPLGLITAAAAWPLALRGLGSIKDGRVTLESFLGASVVAAVAAGESVAALEILWITSAGEMLQSWITERSRRAIRDILQVTEKNTYVLKDGVEVSVAVRDVRPGDTVVLHTGEKISVDGAILKGEAIIDESPINGSSEPMARSIGARVFAGTFVRQGVIFVEAQQVGDKTYLARILAMVEASLENQAPIEGVADRMARRLVRIGLAATGATLLVTGSVWRAFTVMLVMACPCATILAASTAVTAALSAAARRHILIKGGRHLEMVGKTHVICFDKTGTLTTNKPEIRQLLVLDDLPEQELLRLAHSTEIHNSHPVALAIKSEAERLGIEPIAHDICEYFLGKGVRSEIHGEEVLVGSHKLMEQFEVSPEPVRTILERFKTSGLTLVFIARNRSLKGVMGFANQERPEVGRIISRLRNEGIRKTAMVTGDAKYSALEMAERLHFDECHYSILPENKARIVTNLKKNGEAVLMVGDGINDALALAEADVGIAMGAGGSEVAIEAADIALVKDDLSGVIYVRALSRETLRIVHQNFWIATGSNLAGVALGALGILSPVSAGLIHVAHTLGILVNSGRLLFFEAPEFPVATKP